MDNIFEGAKFGSEYEARDGAKVIFVGFTENGACVVKDGQSYAYEVQLDGIYSYNNYNLDVISKWTNSINSPHYKIFCGSTLSDEISENNKLDDLSRTYVDASLNINNQLKLLLETVFKDGYKAAVQDINNGTCLI